MTKDPPKAFLRACGEVGLATAVHCCGDFHVLPSSEVVKLDAMSIPFGMLPPVSLPRILRLDLELRLLQFGFLSGCQLYLMSIT